MPRDEDRRRQDSAARLRAAGITPPPVQTRKPSPLVYVAAVLGLFVIVGLVAYLLNQGSGTSATATYKVAAAKGVVTLGDTSAPVKVDIYEDYLCPACKVLSERDHDALTEALNGGEIVVRFHPIAILNDESTPQGYSSRAANAALCAVDAGIFPAYHDRLFADQPAVGGAGLTDAQLTAFGTDLGAGSAFSSCVTKGSHAKEIEAETNRAASDPALTAGGFGTPTVAVGGKKEPFSDSDWLDDAIAAG